MEAAMEAASLADRRSEVWLGIPYRFFVHFRPRTVQVA